MLDTMIHVNSKGEVLDFIALGIYINYNDLRDYEWQISKSNEYISLFTRGVTNKVIPFVFYCSEKETTRIKNLFYEHFEVDILTHKAGYFEINKYRYYCYLVKSKKSDYLMSKRLLRLETEVASDRPYWIKENAISYNPDDTHEAMSNKTYPYQYAYTLGKTPGNDSIENKGMKASDFKFVIYGPISNPSISIAGHLYSVRCEVGNSEYLVIDSESREIYINTIAGEKINVFDKRNFDNYIFEKIPVGYSLLAWSGGFGFDLIIYDERSEPEWI